MGMGRTLNPQTSSGFGTSAEYVELREKVFSVDRDVSSIRQSIDNLAVRFDSSISQLHVKFEERSKTPWAVIFAGLGVVLSLVMAVGAIAYAPIAQSMSDVKNTLYKNEELSRQDNARQWSRIVELRSRMDYMRGWADASNRRDRGIPAPDLHPTP